MYAYLLCHNYKKAKQVQNLKKKQNYKQSNGGKQATIKASRCLSSHSDHRQRCNSTAASQGAKPQLVDSLPVTYQRLANRCSFNMSRNPSFSATVLMVTGSLFHIDEHWYSTPLCNIVCFLGTRCHMIVWNVIHAYARCVSLSIQFKQRVFNLCWLAPPRKLVISLLDYKSGACHSHSVSCKVRVCVQRDILSIFLVINRLISTIQELYTGKYQYICYNRYSIYKTFSITQLNQNYN